MEKNILIFASKRVGLETLLYLLKTKAKIEKVIVANDTDKYNRRITRMLDRKKIRREIYKDNVQEELVREGKNYEWLLNLWSPYILKSRTLALARKRLNIHSGIVPLCRGNDNAAWCIRRGLSAGVALLEMEKNVDRGDIFIQKQIDFSFPITGKKLHRIIQNEAVRLFNQNWLKIFKGQLKPREQKGSINTFTRKQTENDRNQNALKQMSIKECLNWILAHDFYPNTTAKMRDKDSLYSVRVEVKKFRLRKKNKEKCQ